MHQAHLNPAEIDILLDGNEGFGSHPMRKHLAGCPECAGRLARARLLVDLLEDLPYEPATPGFADRVMARVQVFEPWHVTLLDTLRRFTPQSRPVRRLALAGAGGFAFSFSALALWMAFRPDSAAYAAQLGWAIVQQKLFAAGGSLIASTLGEPALAAVRDGGAASLALGASVVLGLFIVMTIGLRGLVAVARRREH